MVNKAPTETPTPMPTWLLVDSEEWMCGGEEPGEEDAAAEGIFGPIS